MVEIENPGASADAHGASESVFTDTLDIIAIEASRQGDGPASRLALIRWRSSYCMFDGDDCVDTYDTVPDQARTDPAIGTVLMRETLFLALASIVESLHGGWPFNLKTQGVERQFSGLIREFGDNINLELVEKLFIETLRNEGVLFDADFDEIKGGEHDVL